jgi:gamma-glutamyltranspeptidase / glutathione hydrolase
MMCRRRSRRLAALLLGAALLAACHAPRDEPPLTDQPSQDSNPEAESRWTDKPGWATTKFAVAAANPLATDAGYQVLRAGGSAIDAAIAVQMVLTLVEPQSSGIGGGTFVLHWNGKAVEAFDGRETAPAAADERLFLEADGRPMGFFEAVVGGRSVGTSGTLRVLELAHRRYGKLQWRALFQPAIHLAEEGFRISPRLHILLRADEYLKSDPVARAYFYDRDGEPHRAGTLLRNAALASTLKVIAERGADAFYMGDVADEIVTKVRSHATNPGRLTTADLGAYRAVTREALCSDWKRYRVCGFPPPSSGGIAVAQILGILERVQIAQSMQDGLPTPETLHVYAEAARLAFADRAQYVGDPAFVAAPAGSWSSLLDPAYLAERAALIGGQAATSVQPGVPRGTRASYAPMPPQPESGTSHVSIVDPYGYAIAMTTTIENQFGSRQMVRGFLLNNQLTDFSFVPADSKGRPVANRVEPGKRPRSSMSPTLVFDRETGRLVMSAGAPGGAMIIHYTAKTLLATLDWNLNAQQAIALPNFGVTDGPLLLEAGRFARSKLQALGRRGHDAREVALPSGVHAIQRTPTGWFGGADPRREGTVAGE